MYSNHLLRRFVKDYSLPIQLVQEPYFSYYVELYDRVYQSKKHFALLQDTIQQFGDEEKFLQYYNLLKDQIIAAIKITPEFQQFNNDRLDEFTITNKIGGSGDIYKPMFDGKCFLSFDLKKANYNSLKFYHPNMVMNTDTFDVFISLFTDDEYIKQSKYIRQVIFGNLNPKKQQKIQKYIVNILCSKIVDFYDVANIRNTSFDEIVVELDAPEDYLLNQVFQNEIKKVVHDLGIELNVEIFYLKQLKPFSYFVKEYIEPKDKIEFKAVNVFHMPQVYKHYFQMPLHPYDFMFFHEGYIAKYMEPLHFDS